MMRRLSVVVVVTTPKLPLPKVVAGFLNAGVLNVSSVSQRNCSRHRSATRKVFVYH
jgi:hypothetical protein